jgi:hypothetical protein
MLSVTTLGSAGASEYLSLKQKIEGLIFSRCKFGTAEATPIYISFLAQSSVGGTFTLSFRNGASNRSYLTEFTVSAASTRKLCQVTIPGDTSGTWVTDNTAAAIIDFTASCGATLQGSVGSWQAGDFKGTAAGQMLNGQTGTLRISDLYIGTEPISGVTTDYPHVPSDVELVRCKRYLRRHESTGSSSTVMASGNAGSTTSGTVYFPWDYDMRAVPTLTNSAVGNFNFGNTVGTQTVTSISLSGGTNQRMGVLTIGTGAGAFAAGQAARLSAGVTTATIDFSAEL